MEAEGVLEVPLVAAAQQVGPVRQQLSLDDLPTV